MALVALSGCLLDGPTRPTPDPARDFLTNFLGILQQHSVRRDSIDWPALRAAVLEAGVGSPTIVETHGALTLGLEMLGDNHSWIRLPDGAYLPYEKSVTCTAPTVESPTDIPADIGYLRIAAFSGTVAQEGAYTSAIQMAMEQQDSPDLVGWVIDLRGNGGGNMWPMLASLWPFLQDVVGYFVTPNNAWVDWYLEGPNVWLGQTFLSEATYPYSPNVGTGRVAILTDKRVASAGEATAIAFRGMANARSFGGETCGVPTGITRGLIGGGYELGLATAWMTDRDSTIYGAPFAPDEAIVDPVVTVTRAIEWIRTGM